MNPLSLRRCYSLCYYLYDDIVEMFSSTRKKLSNQLTLLEKNSTSKKPKKALSFNQTNNVKPKPMALFFDNNNNNNIKRNGTSPKGALSFNNSNNNSKISITQLDNELILSPKNSAIQNKTEILQAECNQLYNLYLQRDPPNVIEFVNKMLAFLTSKNVSDYNAVIQETYDSLFKVYKRSFIKPGNNKETTIKYTIRSLLPSPAVYHNQFPYEVLPEKDTFYTYLLNDKGLHIGEVDHLFEFGVGHSRIGINKENIKYNNASLIKGQQLLNKKRVLVAGELKISPSNKKIQFNFISGTFMLHHTFIKNMLWYKQFIIKALQTIFGYRLDYDVDFIDNELIKTDSVPFPTFNQILTECATKRTMMDFSDTSLLPTPRGNTLCKAVIEASTSVPSAQEFFKKHPYEEIRIKMSGTTYHNPDPENPSNFVEINQQSYNSNATERLSQEGGKRRRKTRRRSRRSRQ